MSLRFGDGSYGAQAPVGVDYFNIVTRNYQSYKDINIGDFLRVNCKEGVIFLGKVVDIEERFGIIGLVLKNKYDLQRFWFSVQDYHFDKLN